MVGLHSYIVVMISLAEGWRIRTIYNYLMPRPTA